jgi:hypothetical protein
MIPYVARMDNVSWSTNSPLIYYIATVGFQITYDFGLSIKHLQLLNMVHFYFTQNLRAHQLRD